jgi:hypothetical protein
MGNYLNADSVQGNQPGFLIGTLALLDNVKGIGMEKYTLMDFVVSNVKAKEPNLINFYKDFEDLESVLQIDLVDTENKVKEFDNNVKKLQKEKELISKDKSQQIYFNFIKDLENDANEKLNEIFKLQTNMNNEITEITKYFGEDLKNFKLMEFIKIIQTFVSNFKKISIKFSAEEAKQIKKQINENKKPETKIKYVKEMEKIMQTVERKTMARKTAMKNTLKEIKTEEILRGIKSNPTQNKEKKAGNLTRMTRTRITKFIKESIEDSDEERNSIENDYLMINQPNKLTKLNNLKTAHRSIYISLFRFIWKR